MYARVIFSPISSADFEPAAAPHLRASPPAS
jgi:hypothetical protein